MGDKYPRTPHLPWSPGVAEDDVTLRSLGPFVGRPITILEKLDGGNCCLHRGAVFARTHRAPADHESFQAVKALYKTSVLPMLDVAIEAAVAEVPAPLGPAPVASDDVKLFGENMAAVHSIDYTPADSAHALPGPFFLFAVLDTVTGAFWSWPAVAHLAATLGLPVPPVLFHGTVPSVEKLEATVLGVATGPSLIGPGAAVPREGCVVRCEGPVAMDAFGDHVAKYVRPGHVQTDATFKWSWRKARIQW